MFSGVFWIILGWDVFDEGSVEVKGGKAGRNEDQW